MSWSSDCDYFIHLFWGCAIHWAPLVHVLLSPQGCQPSWGAGLQSVLCPSPSLSFSQPCHAVKAARKQCGKLWCVLGWGHLLVSSQPPHCHQQRPKGLQSSLRYFIWLVSNKCHSPNSKFLLRTIYGQFTAWRINAITKLKYFWITKLKKLCSAFRETALKKDVAFINRAFTCKLFQGEEAKTTPALPPGICYRVYQVSRVHKIPRASPGALNFPELTSP